MTIRTLALSLTLCTTATLLIAQNTTGISFKSKSGDFEISNITDQLFEANPQTNAIDFEFTGKPLRGRSSTQKIAFTASRATGQIRSGKDGTMYLLKANLTGSVDVTQNPGTSEEVQITSPSMTISEAANRSSATINFPGPVTIHAKSPTTKITAAGGSASLVGSANTNRELRNVKLSGTVNATITQEGTTNLITTGLDLDQAANSSSFTLSRPFTLTNNSKNPSGQPQKVILKATAGTITTPNITKPSSGRPITTANLRGRVTIDFTGTDRDGSPVDLSASGDRLTMDAKGEILLIGNVKITGNGLDYQSDGESQTVYILVNEQMEPTRYGARGNPTKVNIKPDGGKP